MAVLFLLCHSLHTIGMHAQEQNDSLVNVAFGTVAQEDLTHAISTVNTSDLTKKTANNNSLVGLESFIGGYNGSVWGQAPLILVDGVPRSASNVRASEVESVTVLKDAAAVVLYGSRAAKGWFSSLLNEDRSLLCTLMYVLMWVSMFRNLILNIWMPPTT